MKTELNEIESEGYLKQPYHLETWITEQRKFCRVIPRQQQQPVHIWHELALALGIVGVTILILVLS